MDTPAIEARDLRKRALAGFSLTVPRGVCFGLAGPAGAGKTTFALIASGQLRADGGYVQVLGKAPASERVALLPAASEPHRLLEFLGRAAAGDTAPALSGARRLARALGLAGFPAAAPELLIVDEVGSLDHASLGEALRLVRLLTARGLTILMCSRAAASIHRLCGSVAVVRAGRVVSSGAAAELFGTPGFRLTVADLSDELQEALAHDGLTIGYNSGGYWIESCNRAQLDGVIDRIRLEGGRIERLEDLSVL